jgi:hypothetical protein
LTSFGGPIAHLGYFRQEFVERRKWLTEQTFADLVALCNFLPGPTSSQVCYSIGMTRGGIPGAISAWSGFTLPSAIIMLLAAYGIHWVSEEQTLVLGSRLNLQQFAHLLSVEQEPDSGSKSCPGGRTTSAPVEFLSLLLRESESAWMEDYGTIPGELGKSARRAQEAMYRRELEEAAAVDQWDTDWKTDLNPVA